MTIPNEAAAGEGRGEARVESPVDRRAVRVSVGEAMGVDAGPWTLGPDDPAAQAVYWLDAIHATVDAGPLAAATAGDVNPDPDALVRAVLGPAGPRSRAGVQRREVVVGGWRVVLDVEPEHTARLRERARRGREDTAHSGPLEVRALIPGRVVAVSVAEGDAVTVGQQLLVVEAMKMQNELRSPRAGVVERIAVGVGQTVELGAVLLVIR